ncbi:C2 domain-containing protein [Plectosphaerella plurivora]|uniref:C2 domain-containing protein n=1 Tax=Plectosphaerella plurivora TaxID=936078 RepID=A0A9P8VIM4_9PEZI|nr:C2 domain-containing protein [Plectosphaerella plurivora]
MPPEAAQAAPTNGVANLSLQDQEDSTQNGHPPPVDPDAPLPAEAEAQAGPTANEPYRFDAVHQHHNQASQFAHHPSDMKGAFTEQKKKIKENLKNNPPGGFDTTPLPDAPPGYTIKIIFHRADNLPVGDISTLSSDPYIHATLKAPIPRRHKEEPDLTWRTRTMRKTTTPEWNEEWIVANVPSAGFTLKCRLYDEDYPDSDDRLGNVTINCNHLSEDWAGYPPPGHEFKAKKRSGSKTAYLVKAIVNKGSDITPSIWVSIQVLGVSQPPHAQMYTVGPAVYFKHFSPIIGRLTGTKVYETSSHDYEHDSPESETEKDKRQTQRYDFQSNEMQLAGPVPPEMYHRFVEFRQSIGRMFTSQGVRGRILSKALHKQHRRVYNFNKSTEHGFFKPCSEEASIEFLRLAHFDEGGRIFTYVLTLDGMFRFTETGSEFSIDMLSKHTMHSDVATYIACSGEFFIRRLSRPTGSSDPEPAGDTHPDDAIPGGPPREPPPYDPAYYQLIIDNDSGTYRPDKSILPLLREFLEHNFPGLGILAMHCGDEKLQHLKHRQTEVKQREGRSVPMVQMRSPSSSSLSSLSSAESDLGHMEAVAAAAEGDGSTRQPSKTKREVVLDLVEDPKRAKDLFHEGGVKGMMHGAGAKV